MSKCLWCRDELPANKLFCKKEDYKYNLPDGCGKAYVKTLKTQRKENKIPLSEFEEGVLSIVKKFGIDALSDTPLNVVKLNDVGSTDGVEKCGQI